MGQQQESANQPRRLFFALWPDDRLREQLRRIADEIVPRGHGRRVRTENLHLTLAFLGSVDRPTQACYERAADAVRTVRFSLTLDQVGCWRRTGVLWIGSAVTPEGLQKLVNELTHGLAGCGFDPETRPYHVHVTLARNVRRFGPQRAIPPLSWEIDRFVLVESHTGQGGSRYEILRFWELANGEQ